MVNTQHSKLGSLHSRHMHSCVCVCACWVCVCMCVSVCVCACVAAVSVTNLWEGHMELYIFIYISFTVAAQKCIKLKPTVWLFLWLCCPPDVRVSAGSCGRPAGIQLLFRHVRVCPGAGSSVFHRLWLDLPLWRQGGQVRRYCITCRRINKWTCTHACSMSFRTATNFLLVSILMISTVCYLLRQKIMTNSQRFTCFM